MRNTLLIVALVTSLVSLSACSKKQPAKGADITITLSADFAGRSENVSDEVTIQSGETVFKAMLNAGWVVGVVGLGDRMILTDIDNIKSEGASGLNWIYYVNGDLAKSSCGVFQPKQGDHIEWKFAENPFEESK